MGGMSYRIRPDRDLLTEGRAIAAEQATKAQRDLIDIDTVGVVEGVHDARKRCKKIRGLARIVRPALGEKYQATNQAFRDAARVLSPYRDAHALLETFDRLVRADADRLPNAGLGAVRDELAARARASTVGIDRSHETIEQALELMRDGMTAIDAWALDDDGWDAIGPGLAKTYTRGVDALAEASNDGTSDNFHELRKRAKYTWYHVRLLKQTAPSILKPFASRLHDLSDALGDAHDLSVLTDRIRRDPDAFGGEDVVDAAVAFIDVRRRDLERRSLISGHRLYVESPKCFTRRLGSYWEGHGRWGDEVDVGEMDEIIADSTTDDFDDLTVSELRDVAREAGLSGRSSMTRDELIASLRASGIGQSDR